MCAGFTYIFNKHFMFMKDFNLVSKMDLWKQAQEGVKIIFIFFNLKGWNEAAGNSEALEGKLQAERSIGFTVLQRKKKWE